MKSAGLGALTIVACVAGCRCGPSPDEVDAGDLDAPADAESDAPADAEIDAPADAETDAPEDAGRCPHDMVRVARRFCVDRFESSLVDHASGRTLSPYYAPSRKLAVHVERIWRNERLEVGDEQARAMPLPPLPDWQQRTEYQPRAMSRRSVVPNGYVSGELAVVACKNAGKRLCTIDEWRLACRGEQDRLFPYGPEHVQGKCNMFRESHPAYLLHGNAAKGHLDPRLNQVTFKGKPLLRKTGETAACVSEWEGDGIHDMVGNLDEWIDDPEGTFVGGFYSRAKKDGCDSTVRGHPTTYFDYSTGVRCCAEILAPDGDAGAGEGGGGAPGD